MKLDDRQLDGDVTTLQLPDRVQVCLAEHNIRTLGDLASFTENDLLSILNLGESSVIADDATPELLTRVEVIHTIRDQLAELDLRLGMEMGDRASRRRPIDRPIETLMLGVRGENCLRAAGINFLKELVMHNSTDLLRLPNLGLKTLVEIKEKLAELDLSLNMGADEGGELGAASSRRITSDFEISLRNGFDTLEDELAYIVAKCVSPKDRHLVLTRFGWSGGERRTLNDIAVDTSLSGRDRPVSRERIRQIENKAERRIRRSLKGIAPPKLRESIDLIEDHCPIPLDEVGRLLRDRGISSTELSYAALTIAASLAGQQWPFEILHWGSHSILISQQDQYAETYRDIIGVLVNHRSDAFIDVREIEAEIFSSAGAVGRRVGLLIDALREYQWLDRSGGIFWRVPKNMYGQTNKVLFICRKLFTVKKEVTVKDLRNALDRARTVDVTPSQGVLLEMLRQTELFDIDGSTIRVRSDVKFNDLSRGDIQLLKAAKGLGRTVRFIDLRDNLVREGMTSGQADVYITAYSPFLYRISRGRYRVFVDSSDLDFDQFESDRRQTSESEPNHQTKSTESRITMTVTPRLQITGKHKYNNLIEQERTWTAIDQDGRYLAECKTRNGLLYQLKDVLDALGVSKGDELTADFDTTSDSVTFKLACRVI